MEKKKNHNTPHSSTLLRLLLRKDKLEVRSDWNSAGMLVILRGGIKILQSTGRFPCTVSPELGVCIRIQTGVYMLHVFFPTPTAVAPI